MVAGGRPLWYIQSFTTFSMLFLTLFFMGVCLSWGSGLRQIMEDPGGHLQDMTPKERQFIVNWSTVLLETVKGANFFVNMGFGLLASAAGVAFSYALYREKVQLIYCKIWFATVCSYTLIWMVTSIVFYVELDEIAGRIHKYIAHLPPPLTTVHKWGKENSGATAIALIAFPVILFLFLSFVAYRLYVKINIYGNSSTDHIATETHPGSWFERQIGAEGGTWEREPTDPMIGTNSQPPLVNAQGDEVSTFSLFRRRQTTSQMGGEEKPFVAAATLVEEEVSRDTVTGGWGSWLEDVFDYTF
jgi:hypothetical protein